METEKPKNALPITGQEVPEMDIEAPLASVSVRCCQFYRDAYSKAFRSEADPAKKALLESVMILCSFYPQYQSAVAPYRPHWSDGEKRSALPDDLTQDDLGIVKKLLNTSRDHALRARLADVLWLRKKDLHEVARDAVTDYIAAAQPLLKPPGWIHAIELFQRALQLGAALGRHNDPYKLAAESVVKAVDEPIVTTERFLAGHLFPLIRDFHLGDAAKMAEVAKSLAAKGAEDKDYRRERLYLRLEADFCEAANDRPRADAVRLTAAETYIREAEEWAGRTEPSYFAASDSLAKGIEALRQAHGDAERIQALKRRLTAFQAKSMGEMKSFTVPVDLTAVATGAAEHVKDNDFRRAMILLALGVSPLDVAKLREEVIESIQHAPLTHLIGGSIVDGEGRPIAHKKPLLGLVGEEAEKALENEMFQHAAQIDWRFRAEAFIEPARVQIWRQHRPRPQDLEYLVIHNPFIPPGHEDIFLQGLYHGLAGDFMIASHLLTPQLENSIRYVVEQHGGDVTNLYSDLTQPVKTLGPVLELPEAKRLFGDDLWFELRGLLIEKRGYSFRNNLAHGFLGHADCYSAAAINVWWIVLKLCHSTMILPEDMADETRETENKISN